MQNGPTASTRGMEDSKISAQHWIDLQTIVGQSTSFPKSATQILSHIEKDRALEIDYEFQYNAVLTNMPCLRSNMFHLTCQTRVWDSVSPQMGTKIMNTCTALK